MGFWRNPTDLQRQGPTPLADAFGKKRQTMTDTHPFRAMHVAQRNGAGLGAWIIARIQNPNAPVARCRAWRSGVLCREPGQTLLSQLLQPIIIRDRLGQLLARTINSSVKAAPPITPQRAQREFYRRDWARPDCQDID